MGLDERQRQQTRREGPGRSAIGLDRQPRRGHRQTQQRQPIPRPREQHRHKRNHDQAGLDRKAADRHPPRDPVRARPEQADGQQQQA